MYSGKIAVPPGGGGIVVIYNLVYKGCFFKSGVQIGVEEMTTSQYLELFFFK
jgi:hypothetical protein